MAAIAVQFGDILSHSLAAVVAAIFVVASCRTVTNFVFTSSLIHKKSPVLASRDGDINVYFFFLRPAFQYSAVIDETGYDRDYDYEGDGPDGIAAGTVFF